MAVRGVEQETDKRFGRLTEAPGPHEVSRVRCACVRCGAHLMARGEPDKALEGWCPVCLSQRFEPVDRH
ncbi:MAG: hypothetical protein QOF76_73 [Solirubrobacteraceae bacterium]|nr:hypothetical protein [Solirubrobacteraceae bacterium]